MKTKQSILTILLVAFGLALAGCSDNNSTSNTPPSTPPPPSTNAAPAAPSTNH